MAADTILELDFGVAPYSARNLDESLSIDSASQRMERTWNGTLVDLSNPNFRKYVVKIDGSDVLPPAYSRLWPGQSVVVSCASELCHKVGATPERTEVPGSGRTFEDFYYYRPVLTCRVDSFDMKRSEWGGKVTWSLTLVEV